MHLHHNSFDGSVVAPRFRAILQRDYGALKRAARRAKRRGLVARHWRDDRRRQIWFVESHSDSTLMHEVYVTRHGVELHLHCDCEGWGFGRVCQHAGIVLQTAQLGPFAPDPLAAKPVDPVVQVALLELRRNELNARLYWLESDRASADEIEPIRRELSQTVAQIQALGAVA